MKKYRTAFLLFLVFETLAVVLWQLKDSLFLLFNFRADMPREYAD